MGSWDHGLMSAFRCHVQVEKVADEENPVRNCV